VLRLLASSESAQWDAFVAAHPLGTIYHTSAWREVIERAYRYEPAYIVCEEKGQLVAGLPLFRISSPLTGTRLTSVPGAQSCDPLVRHQADATALVDYATSLLRQRGAKSLELRTTSAFAWRAALAGHSVNGYSCYHLALPPDPAILERSLHNDSIRRRIRRAQASQVTVAVGSGPADVRQFYDLYLRLRRRLGLLPQPYRFFESMWSVLSPRGHIDVLHARYRGETVSSLLLLKHGRTVIYEYGATDPVHVQLGASPFLLWEAITRAIADRFEVFDFGRTADENQGLTDFKRKWGAVQQPLSYIFLPGLSSAANLRSGRQARELMTLAIRHAPETLCEVLGRALYRHLA
jgi:CelD/BcsL family acetyltransferase involved in cellulose biosynthesis